VKSVLNTNFINKVIEVSEAVELINDGDNITISGFGPYIMPMALVREIIKQGKKKLELTSVGEAWAADLLIGAKCITKIRLSNYMFEGFGRCYNFSRAVEGGIVQVEDYSHFGITNRLFAGALGVPFMPTKVMQGTDLVNITNIEDKKCFNMNSPFNQGEKILLLPSINPDVALIHAARADAKGNIQLFGSSAAIDQQARSAKKVIVSVEEIVDAELINKFPELTIIPSFIVDAVVKIPFGAHPGGICGYYDYDETHLNDYWIASKNPDGFLNYLDEYIYNIQDHWCYLDKIGLKRLFKLRVDPYLRYSEYRGDK